jgi:mono/diheme cytochrome c family protein
MTILKGFAIALTCGCLVVGTGVATLPAKSYEGVLQEPVVLGAWLYRWKCLGCHGDYGQDRFGREYDGKEALTEAIESKGCRTSWSQKNGGPFAGKEIGAVVAFVRKWEEQDGPPSLPPLPPTPEEEVKAVATTPRATKDAAQDPAPKTGEPALSRELQQLMDSNQVAHGAWLYTRNCYRCHLTYGQGRMGKGLPYESVQRFIIEGKTTTQMKPFSQMFGGELKNSEIKNITTYITTWEKAGEPLAIAKQLMTPPALDQNDFKPLRLTRFKPVQGDISAGERLYRLHCGGCHGRQGEGYLGTGLRHGKWTQRPDLFFKAVVKKGVPGTLMKSWDSSAGGRFSAKEIDDLVAFVTLWQQQEKP